MNDATAQSGPNPEVTFFVPCLNEEKNVAGALQMIMAAVAKTGVSYEVLVFDETPVFATAEIGRAHV